MNNKTCEYPFNTLKVMLVLFVVIKRQLIKVNTSEFTSRHHVTREPSTTNAVSVQNHRHHHCSQQISVFICHVANLNVKASLLLIWVRRLIYCEEEINVSVSLSLSRAFKVLYFSCKGVEIHFDDRWKSKICFTACYWSFKSLSKHL